MALLQAQQGPADSFVQAISREPNRWTSGREPASDCLAWRDGIGDLWLADGDVDLL